MRQYIGTKIISAEPMTRADAEAHLGRNVGGDKHGDGYLVQYSDSYQSWSPEDVFSEAYRPINGMTFGLALEALKVGRRVARTGWNGGGMFLVLVSGGDANHPLIEGGADVVSRPTIGIWYVDGYAHRAFQNGWVASQTDMLAEDWVIVE